MNGPSLYFTFWEVAEQWAEELNMPVKEVIKRMKAHCTYKVPHPYHCPPPSLKIMPQAFVSVRGEVDVIRIADAQRMVEKDQPGSATGNKHTSKYRANYRTPEFNAALAFLNSSESPPVLTEEIKKHLSQFVILREDFEKFCTEKEYSLPRFWFPSIHQNAEHEEKATLKAAAMGTPEEYIQKRRADGATQDLIIYELREDYALTNRKIARLLDVGIGGNDAAKQEIQRRFTKEARKRGTWEEIQARNKK
jgi:hypothetical protein